MMRKLREVLVKLRVLAMQWAGWGYAVYCPSSAKLIWTPKLAEILGVECNRRVLVTDWQDFAAMLFDGLCRDSLSENIGSGHTFHMECIARHGKTGGQMFIKIAGRWMRERGRPVLLEMFIREISAKDHDMTFMRIRLRRFIDSFVRDGSIPESILNHVPSHDRP